MKPKLYLNLVNNREAAAFLSGKSKTES